ncbi:ankyrin repeats (3 copies) domain-containing protein [Ditylenchus destructor]|nr:ankyrin repeats (3 copies) domain-containing protein [Ditylenchus destructor]
MITCFLFSGRDSFPEVTFIEDFLFSEPSSGFSLSSVLSSMDRWPSLSFNRFIRPEVNEDEVTTFRRDPGASTVVSEEGFRYCNRKKKANHPVYKQDWKCTATGCPAYIFVTGEWETDGDDQFMRGVIMRTTHGTSKGQPKGRPHPPPAKRTTAPATRKAAAPNANTDAAAPAVTAEAVTTSADARGDRAATLSPAALSPIAQPDTPVAATPPYYPGLFDEPAQDPADAEDENERLRRELAELHVQNADLVGQMGMQARDNDALARENEELKEEREKAVEEVKALKRKLADEQRARAESDAKLARLLEGAAGPAEDLQRPGTSQGPAQPNQPGAPGRMGPQAAPADLAEDLETIDAQNLLDRTHQADDSMPALDLLDRTHQADESASSAEENARRLNPEEAARNLAEIRQMAREAPVRSFVGGDPRIAAPIVMERLGVRIEPREQSPREQFMAAAKDDNLAELQRICAAHPELLQAEDPLKDDALHPAAHNNFVDVFEWLLSIEKPKISWRLILSNFSKFQAEDPLKDDALHPAAHNNFVDVCEWLLSIGANPEFRTRDGWTPLHRAAHRANHQIVALLIQHGVSINSVANRKTPLHMAIESKENRALVLETIKVLLAAPGMS